MSVRWFVVAAALLVGGCSSDVGMSQAELQAQWDAQNVVPATYKDDLLAFLRTYLNDPTHIRDASISQPQLETVGPGKRYLACVRFNARGVGGKYAGPKVGAAVYVAGKLDRFLDGPNQAQQYCKDAAYAPFPELEKLRR
jgi:hypothetical protein